MATPFVSPNPTMPRATELATPPPANILEDSHSVIPVESLPLCDTGNPHELIPTHGVLMQGRAAYYWTQCTFRVQRQEHGLYPCLT